MSRLDGSRLDVGTLVVDVSNVCRDDRLIGEDASLERLDLVLDAWRAELCRHVDVLGVADRSLLKELSLADVRRLERMHRDGGVLIAVDADATLLDHLAKRGGCVLSRDRFRDKPLARSFARESFFSWEIRDGIVRIVPQPPDHPQPFDISQAAEDKALYARRVTRSDLYALRRWACASELPCVTRLATPLALMVAPLERDGIPCCPGCEQPLRDRGERISDVELKFVVDDVVRVRFTLTSEQPLTFGRLVLPDTADMAELAYGGALRELGRRHVELMCRGRHVVDVRPVDAEHAVRRRIWDEQRKRLRRPQRLPAGAFTAIGPRDQLLLGGSMVLLQSGRSIAEAAELAQTGEVASWQVSPTAEA